MGVDASVLKDRAFWRAVFIEFFGTTLFLLLVTAVLTVAVGENIVRISFAVGLAIAVLVHVFGPISGAHFNPAITLGTLVTGDCGVFQALFYIIAQLLGGIAGSAISFGLNEPEARNSIDGLRLGDGLNAAQGFFMELFLTSILVFTYLASCSCDNNRRNLGFVNSLAIGLAIVLAHLVGIPYTGAGINPARAFAPSLVVNQWQSYHWIYWIAPLVGGVVSALFYRFIIKAEIGEKGDRHERMPLAGGH